MDGPLNRFAKELALLLGVVLALCSACAELGEESAGTGCGSLRSFRTDRLPQQDGSVASGPAAESL